MPNTEERAVRIAKLTRRERDCLLLVADNMTSGEIANALGLSESRVDNLILAARAKLEAPSRKVAARWVTQADARSGAGQNLPGPELPGAPPALPDQSASRPMPANPPAIVREEPSSFVGEPSSKAQGRLNDVGLASRVQTLATVMAVAVGFAILLLALDPLAQSAAKLANLIDPPSTQPGRR